MIRKAKLVGIRSRKDTKDVVEATFVCQDDNVKGYAAMVANVYRSGCPNLEALELDKVYTVVCSGFTPNVKIHAVM